MPRFCLVICGVLFGTAFIWRAAVEWQAVREGGSGDFVGWATLVSDPEPGAVVRVILKVRGDRYVAFATGVAARRIDGALAGESVLVRGRLSNDAPSFLMPRHVVGRIELDEVSEIIDHGSALHRATNRLRRVINDGARTMSSANSALFTGLVIGDDRLQPKSMIEDFRQSGMSHLTAVSGQNVALMLAAFAPLLTRLRPAARFTATLGVIGWFVILTRAEPSVLRAAGMSAVGAYGFLRGRHRSAVAVLAICVTGMLLIDPLLGWSVGWWLSVSASLGISVLAKPIASRIPLPPMLADVIASTAAAQVATLPISLVVFGRFAPLGLIANLLTVPVAGLIMFMGIPLGLIAGVSPDWVAELMMWPVELAVSWVKFVAGIFAI